MHNPDHNMNQDELENLATVQRLDFMLDKGFPLRIRGEILMIKHLILWKCQWISLRFGTALSVCREMKWIEENFKTFLTLFKIVSVSKKKCHLKETAHAH